MSKELSPLEALNDLIDLLENEHLGLSEDDYVKERKHTIETVLNGFELARHICLRHNINTQQELEIRLQALEIIKRKEMLSVFKDISGKCFIVFNTTAIEIPQEEYELLKEVLKHE